ncbi:pilus assembly protein N-terminal domain-containing protein [Hyphomonas oceanitis]|uniref:Pilus formation protein N-terminal domain-containing protein n=1 Tax=Hyphomonas oceanitis SCH89 TaxID=1280953 RepID=A0A059G9I6_9PROT|nr:pilus assembly protein N-terminal domain-containing protein [Hyphomonas oceanitis]KDA03245.1 hypothetical protein HOC_06403 [Hyphomonas oceanitis SCH89]|tara:strand:- start:8719 stop:9162 length:444 start_codon:yes stop_codon:yes gene_type:complete
MNILAKSCTIAFAASLLAGAAAARDISVETNKTVPVRISGGAASIVIGNKNIADVGVHDEHLIFITGKAFGTTNIMIFDKAGNQIMSSDVVVTSNSANLVTINKSGASYTYDCSPGCRSVMSTGDQAEYFDQIVRQQKGLQSLNDGN